MWKIIIILFISSFMQSKIALAAKHGLAGEGDQYCYLQEDKLVCVCKGDKQLCEIPPDLGGVKVVSTSLNAICVITHDNQIRCWGDPKIVKNVPNIPVKFPTEIVVGLHRACILDSGKVLCWNDTGVKVLNETFQTPHGLSLSYEPLCLVDNGNPFCHHLYQKAVIPEWVALPIKKISTGFNNACVVDAKGSVQCWGDGGWGKNVAPFFPDDEALDVKSDFTHSCALYKKRGVQCWGISGLQKLKKPVFAIEFSCLHSWHGVAIVDDEIVEF